MPHIVIETSTGISITDLQGLVSKQLDVVKVAQGKSFRFRRLLGRSRFFWANTNLKMQLGCTVPNFMPYSGE
jgi:hypothetical protein